MKKAIKMLAWVVIVCAMFSMILAGCGSQPAATDGAKTEAAKADSNAATATATAKEPVKLTFSYWGSPNEKTALEKACAGITAKYPNITVEPMYIPNADYVAKMTAMAAANSLPDCGYMQNELGETWANEGKFENIFDKLKNDKELKKEDFFDFTWFTLSPDNAWGFSTAPEDFAIYYNKDAVKEAGIDAPPATADQAWSWEQFVAAAQKMTLDKNGKNASEAGFDPNNIKQYGIMFETWDVPLTCFIASNGGAWTSEDGKQLTINSPQAVEAIQKLQDLIFKYHVAPSPLAAKSLPALNIAVQNKIAGMVIGGHWMNLDLGVAKANYDIGVLPKMQKCITGVCSAATVLYKSSKHPEEAWTLFKWLGNPDNALDLYTSGLWMPQMKKWYSDPALLSKWVDANPAAHPAGFKTAVVDQFINNAVPQAGFYLKNQSKVISTFVSGLDPVWMGKMSAADAMKAIDAKVQPEFKGRYDK
jgi:multiple sugar transport system substrate-binding protein